MASITAMKGVFTQVSVSSQNLSGVPPFGVSLKPMKTAVFCSSSFQGCSVNPILKTMYGVPGMTRSSKLFSDLNSHIALHRENRSSFVQTEAVRHLTGSVTKTENLRFAVVIARFNEIVTKALLEGALETFKKYSVKEEDVDVVWVPGSFEIGIVAEKLGKSGKYNAIMCIGAVIRGDTTHYDAVANSAASGVLSAGLGSGVPCIFGVLTCDDMDQALNRAGGKAGNKGAEAALTAIEMASLFEHHLKVL